MPYACRIEADSRSSRGKRITTFVLTYPRFVHAELMTHRMFSRNSSSSRAIPIEKMIEQVKADPAGPVWWGRNQKGMQAHEELLDWEKEEALATWLSARDEAVAHAERLIELAAHKQIVNRLLEPWMWITVIVTATEYDNWFALRAPQEGPVDPKFPAQPELQQIAVMMRDAYRASVPVTRDHHLPFHDPERDHDVPTGQLGLVCTARCARVSYLTHDGRRDPQRDVELATSLTQNRHWSPFEHVAYAADLEDEDRRSGNFIGCVQLRELYDGSFIR